MIVSLAGQKGGTGKSTIALSIAVEWSERGRSTLLVDADPQGTVSVWGALGGDEARLPTIVRMGEGMHRGDQLPELARRFEVLVIDCPPAHDRIHRSALVVSDLVLYPVGPSAVEAWSLSAALELLVKVKAIRPDLLAAVLITRKMTQTTIGREARETLEECGLPILATELGYRVAYQEAPAAGLGVGQYAPHSAAAVEIRMLVDELEKMETHHGKIQTQTNPKAASQTGASKQGRRRAPGGAR